MTYQIEIPSQSSNQIEINSNNESIQIDMSIVVECFQIAIENI